MIRVVAGLVAFGCRWSVAGVLAVVDWVAGDGSELRRLVKR